MVQHIIFNQAIFVIGVEKKLFCSSYILSCPMIIK